MDINRRHLIGASAAGVAGALAMSTDDARAAPLTSALGRDATHYGVRPGSPDDQTQILQRAIDDAARAQVPLALPPGVYRTGMLRLQSGTQLVGVRGATRFVFAGGASMFQGEGTNSVGLSNLTLDGAACCIASAGATSALPIARSKALAATASGSRTSLATSAAISSPGRPRPRSCRSMRRACWSRATR
jgi:uncharacterized secreted repeat protein (TIGR03808 family)